mmetsp:Transcript_45533/g.83646  ORF Transcript_45533/g.83646 Transcript_45533/m.83646 type:complete len:458 (-) Transcript_45533:65-1438(-)
MDETYDVIVCGTGLKECILSGLLSVSGNKVLHVDRNSYYGGESASLTLSDLFRKFRPGEEPPAEYGTDFHWNVDLIPKFVMAAGSLVTILLKTHVAKYLEWKVVEGTYVYQYQEAGYIYDADYIHKVPATAAEAAASPLMGMLEKGRCKSFFQFAAAWDAGNPETYQGMSPDGHNMAQVYEYFGLCEDTTDFIGHAVALYTSDDYLTQPCGITLDRIKLYLESFRQYGVSPFIYPEYGLGGIPEGFARLSSLHSATNMLNTPVDGFEYDRDGHVCGVRSGDKVAKCKMVICDPSYAPPSKVRKVGSVIRAICILGAPIPNTGNALSCQVIIPQRQLKRKSDIYISMTSWAHRVAIKDKYIAIVSADVETADPEEEIAPALALLGTIEHKFVTVSDRTVPLDDGSKDKVFVTQSYDATSHFQDDTLEILSTWKAIHGSDLDLSIPKDGHTQEVDFDAS